MSLTPSNLTSNGSGTNATSYATASISPTTGALLIVAVEHDISGMPAVPTISGLGATWTAILDCYYDNSGTQYRLSVFKGVGATGTGALTIDFAGVTQAGCSWSVDQFDGADTTNPIVQSKKSAEPAAASNTTTTVTLDAAITAGNGAWMGASWQGDEVGTQEGGVWTALGNGHHSGPAGAVSTMGTSQSSDNSGTISWVTSSLFGGIILEIKAASASTKAKPPFQKHTNYVWRR